MNIGIVGSGYVGLVTGACLAELGNNVTLVDVDEEKVKKINKKIAPIYEEGLEEILKKNSIKATTDYNELANANAIFICVGTPSKESGDIDLRYIKQASESIGKVIKNSDDKKVIIVKSTVLPGTTEGVIIPEIEKSSGKKNKEHFSVAVNPEFLREGKAVHDFFNPDRIVIGVGDEFAKEKLLEIYKDFKCRKIITNLRTAEMIKYASNAFLACKISFANELGNICKEMGIDSYEVFDAVGLDKRIGREFLNTGIGFGGSCFPKDTKALLSLAGRLNYNARILKAVIETNEEQPFRLINLLEREINSLKNKNIVVLGIAFKPETDDIRESPAIKIIEYLVEKGANVHACDPKAIDNTKKIFGDKIKYYKKAEDAVKKGEIILILTAWNEFKKPELYENKIVFDGRRINEAREKSKFYTGICW